MTVRWLSASMAALLVSSAVFAQQPRPEMNDDPETERRLLTVADGFELQLVASEPTIVNPVQIQFDPQGRLWVLCIPRYPQLLPGQEPSDFITVLEDFDPKGKARKATVFADGLMVPTGLAPGDGGVYIGQADKLLHLKDTKGTGKADQRRVLLAGFGTQDTHHTLNTFRWGPDGNLYFNQGVYIKSDVETPYGLRRFWGGGIWQLRPDRLRLEVHDRSILGNNTWGHIFDSWGRSLCTSAWPDGINLVLPDSPLNDSSAKDVVPPLPLTRVADGRHCGATFITGDHFPPAWRGNLVSGSFAGQLVYRYDIREAGATFAGKQLPPLITSKHGKFRPVDMQMGPDGALYIADWYDEIIQHNQIDFRDPRRDHSRGRIWRVVAKDRPLTVPPKLVGAPVGELLDHLKSSDEWTRQQTKRVLAERGAKHVAPALTAWAARLDAKDPNIDRHRLEALWAAQGIDLIDASLLTNANFPTLGTSTGDARGRAAAMRVAGAWAERLPAAQALLARGAADDDARVRLEAVLALSRIPSSAAFRAALGALDRPSDPLVDFALKRTAIIMKPYWYPEFQKGQLTNIPPRPLAFALQAAGANDGLQQLAKLLKAGQVPAASQADSYAALASLGNSALLQMALEWAAAKDEGPPAADRALVVKALESSARERGIRPSGDLDQILRLMERPDPVLAVAAMRLAGAWKLESARAKLEKRVLEDAGDRGRAALAALIDLGGPPSIDAFEKWSAVTNPYPLRVSALAGLASLDVKRAGPPAARLLSRPLEVGDDPSDLFLAFLGRSGGATALAAALETDRPSPDAAKIGLRVLNSQGTPTGPLSNLLHDAANVANTVRNVTPDEVKRLLNRVQTQGDPHRGELVFRRPALGCQQCHAIGGAGGRVGPDLGSIGASSQVDYLLESILLPDKVIREGYNTAHIITVDGKALSGIVVRESPKEIILRTPSVDELVVPKSSIEERSGGGSLMPQGLAALVTDAELVDLVRFLSEIGKPGPFTVGHAAKARVWSTLATDPPPFANLDDAAVGRALADDRLQWKTVFAKVGGELPIDELKSGNLAFVRCRLDVAVPGTATLKWNSAAGLSLWLDGVPIDAGGRVSLPLTRGTHVLDVRIDRRRREMDVLSCAVEAAPGSPVQVHFVGGNR